TGAFVVASELARARGKRGGVAGGPVPSPGPPPPGRAGGIVLLPGGKGNGGHR
ncbi:ESPR-type extended signal peptide-containing protein, partial [Escherichia coli]|uniref:ESPR-type extended signal peptide-containing protein n=1 Tax=Escherichia coli TaxID=562 RepID=UPI003D819022